MGGSILRARVTRGSGAGVGNKQRKTASLQWPCSRQSQRALQSGAGSRPGEAARRRAHEDSMPESSRDHLRDWRDGRAWMKGDEGGLGHSGLSATPPSDLPSVESCDGLIATMTAVLAPTPLRRARASQQPPSGLAENSLQIESPSWAAVSQGSQHPNTRNGMGRNRVLLSSGVSRPRCWHEWKGSQLLPPTVATAGDGVTAERWVGKCWAERVEHGGLG